MFAFLIYDFGAADASCGIFSGPLFYLAYWNPYSSEEM